jgi:hypothetical protein
MQWLLKHAGLLQQLHVQLPARDRTWGGGIWLE